MSPAATRPLSVIHPACAAVARQRALQALPELGAHQVLHPVLQHW